jgi:hypothetical protein
MTVAATASLQILAHWTLDQLPAAVVAEHSSPAQPLPPSGAPQKRGSCLHSDPPAAAESLGGLSGSQGTLGGMPLPQPVAEVPATHGSLDALGARQAGAGARGSKLAALSSEEERPSGSGSVRSQRSSGSQAEINAMLRVGVEQELLASHLVEGNVSTLEGLELPQSNNRGEDGRDDDRRGRRQRHCRHPVLAKKGLPAPTAPAPPVWLLLPLENVAGAGSLAAAVGWDSSLSGFGKVGGVGAGLTVAVLAAAALAAVTMRASLGDV